MTDIAESVVGRDCGKLKVKEIAKWRNVQNMEIYKERALASHKTFEIRPISIFLKRIVTENKLWIDPFSNDKKVARITNDLNPKYDCDYHMEALDFLKMFNDNSVDGVLFDPPYSPRQVKEVYESFGYERTPDNATKSSFWGDLKNEIQRILKIDGLVISFGWNSNGMGASRGFEQLEILIVAHGGSHNDTICVLEKKVIEQLSIFTEVS